MSGLERNVCYIWMALDIVQLDFLIHILLIISFCIWIQALHCIIYDLQLTLAITSMCKIRRTSRLNSPLPDVLIKELSMKVAPQHIIHKPILRLLIHPPGLILKNHIIIPSSLDCEILGSAI